MADEVPKTPNIPGRQVFLLALLAVAGFVLFYGGLAQLPKRYLYVGAPVTDATAVHPAPSRANTATTADWLQDPLAVCAECHTPKEAERFRKIITPLLAVQSGGYWMATAPMPEMSYAPAPVPAPGAMQIPAAALTPAPSTALAESK